MKKKTGANNQSIEQLLKARLFGVNSNLNIRTYRTTDGYRHERDFRLALTFKDRIIEENFDCICRTFYTSKCSNKAQRDERDECVTRMLSKLTITSKKAK